MGLVLLEVYSLNYLDALKSIYTKEKFGIVDDIGFCISLTKTLSKDQDNIPALKEIVPFLFLVSPEHYFFLLYLGIKKKSYIPRLQQFENQEKKSDEVLEFAQKVLKWSNREMNLNNKILEKVLEDKEFWNEEFGLEAPKKEKIKNVRTKKKIS